MKEMKKILALIMALTVIVSSANVTYASNDMSDVDVVKLLGMLKGDGNGLTDEYLEKKTTRLQAAIMFLRLNGLEDEAMEYSGNITFNDAKEVSWLPGKAILAYLKGNPELGWQGNNDEFNPYDVISSQEYTKVMLEALGYKQGVDFTWAQVFTFATSKGLTKSVNIETFTNRDIATLTVEALKANNSRGIKLVDELVEAKIIDQEIAEHCGLWKSVPIPEIESAVAINSKMVEVRLTDSAEAVDSSVFKVETDDRVIDIVSVELAPWDDDKKTALVLLENDLKSGTLYSITSGENKINFGGKSTDISKPTLSKATGIDYNEFTLEFSEPVRIDSINLSVTERYRGKKSLEVYNMQYIDSKTIRVMTSDQKGSCLYGVSLSGVTDLAGNDMKEDTDNNFVGTAKSTESQVVNKARAIDYNQVYVEFETNIDVDEIDEATFEISQIYRDHKNVEVFSAKQATEAQTVEFDPSNSTKSDKLAAMKKGVVLTVDGIMDDSTLYKVKVTGMKTLYDRGMSSSTADRETSFVGMSKPTGAFAYGSPDIVTVSATSIKVKFDRKIQKDLAEDISNYEIQETYKDKDSLPVLSAELLDDGKTVKLIVAEMKEVLYKLTPKNLVDIYDNHQETGSDIKATFVGREKEEEISNVSISRIDDTHLKLTFNANVGENATDVALYTIDGGVGYPEAALTYEDQLNCVKLTIPETTEAQSYKLTVKGLFNADGVQMRSSDDVTGVFTGQGIAKGLPVVQAAFAIDRQTVKIYFDRDVNCSTIKGVLWARTSNDDVAPFFMIKPKKSNTTYRFLDNLVAYQDSTDRNALIVVDDNISWNTDTYYRSYLFDLAPAYDYKYVRLDDNESELEVPTNDKVYVYPIVDAAQGIDNRTVKVFFSKPVTSFDASDITIKRNSDNSPVIISGNPVPISGTNNREWHVPVDTDMQSVLYTATFKHEFIYDKYVSGIKLSTDKDQQTGRDVILTFAGNRKNINYITRIDAMMPNNRTIDIYFPEPMSYDSDTIDNGIADSSNHQNVDNMNSYLLRKMDGNILPGHVPNIKYVKYDQNTNIATLYLDGNIDSTVSTYGLVVNTHISNITGNRTVAKSSDNNSPVVIEVVNNKNHRKEDKGPGIENATVSGDRMQLRVLMDSVIAFGDDTHNVDTDEVYTTIDEFVNKTTEDTNSNTTPNTTKINVPNDILKALKIVTKFVGENESTIDSGDIANITLGIDGRTLEFNFNKAIAPGASGYITTKTNDTTPDTDLYNYSMVKRSKTENESKIAFAAPNSNIFDHTNPEIAYVTAQGKTYQAGENIDVVLIFNEIVSISDRNKDTKITIIINGVEKEATLQSTTSNTATFRYVVESGLIDSDGIDIKDNSLVLGSGDTITDTNSNPLVINSLDATNLPDVKIDSTILSVMNVTATDKTYVAGENIDVVLTFNKNVTITDTNKDSKITLIIGSVGKEAVLQSTTSNTATFRYIVEEGLSDSDGITVKDDSLLLGIGDSIKDANNNNLELTSLNTTNLSDVKVNSDELTITHVNSTDKTYVEGENIDVMLTFNKNVIVTDADQNSKITLTVDNVDKDASLLTSSGNTATFRYTVEAGLKDIDGIAVKDNSLVLGIGDSIKDLNNNDLDLTSLDTTNLLNVKVDSTVLAIININAIEKTYVAGENIDVTLTFNKSVTVTDEDKNSKIILDINGVEKNAYLLSSVDDTATFRYTVEAGLKDIDGITVKDNSLVLGIGDSIKDTNNNDLNLTTLNTTNLLNVKVDSTALTITNINATEKTYITGENIDVVLIFNKNVIVTDEDKNSKIILDINGVEKNAYLLSSVDDTATFRYNVTADIEDNDGITVKDNSLELGDGDSIKDINSNDLDLTSLNMTNLDNVKIDSKKPTVTDITATEKTYILGENIDVVFTFSEDITITDVNKDSTIKLIIGGIEKSASLLSSTENSVTFRYVIDSGLIDADGISVKGNSLLFGSDDSIKDKNNNDLDLTSINDTSLSNVKLDSEVPTITDITSIAKTYEAGENIDVVLTFNEDIIVTDENKNSKITIIINSQEKNAVLQSSTSNTATFRYVVEANLADVNGIDVKVNSLVLGGAEDSIKDISGNNLDLTLNAKNFPNVKVDSNIPNIVNVTATSNTYTEGQPIDIVLTFSEVVTIKDDDKSSKITIIIGSVEKDAIFVSNTSNTATFRYIIQSGLSDDNGIDVKANSLVLGAEDSIKDSELNDLNVTSLILTNLLDVKVQ